MREMRKLSVVWGIVIFIIFAGLTTFAILWKNKNTKYKKLEQELVTKVEGYFETKYEYPKGTEKIIITTDELKENNIIDSLKIDNDECKGYVEISNNTVIEYKAYLKCNNYTTKDYKEN